MVGATILEYFITILPHTSMEANILFFSKRNKRPILLDASIDGVSCESACCQIYIDYLQGQWNVMEKPTLIIMSRIPGMR